MKSGVSSVRVFTLGCLSRRSATTAGTAGPVDGSPATGKTDTATTGSTRTEHGRVSKERRVPAVIILPLDDGGRELSTYRSMSGTMK